MIAAALRRRHELALRAAHRRGLAMTGLRRKRRRYNGWQRPPPEYPGQGDRIFSASNHHFINACMPHWEPDARERLVVAALQLFSEQGTTRRPSR
jgi:hypothetical protein